MTTTEQTTTYMQNLHQQADELDQRADMLDASLLAPSLKSSALRDEANHLREMAR